MSEEIKIIFADYPIAIQFVNYRMEIATETVTYRLRLHCKDNLPWAQITKRFMETKGLGELAWEEGTVS